METQPADAASEACATGDVEQLDCIGKPSQNSATPYIDLHPLALTTAKSCQPATLSYLLSNSVPIPKSLIIAAFSTPYPNHQTLLSTLLAHGLDPNISLSYLGNPIILAAGQSDIEAIRLLLANGASINTSATFDGGYRLLASAARKGSLETIKVLVEEGGARTKGSAALQAAAMMRRADVLREAIREKTALWMAVAHKVECAKFLLGRGADVSITGKNQRDLVEIAIEEGGEGAAIVDLLKRSRSSGQSRWYDVLLSLVMCVIGESPR